MSKIYPCIYCTDDLHCTKYTDENYESWCVLGPCKDETPSNADRIRAMTDEELAEWLTALEIKAYSRIGYSGNEKRFKLQYIEWLKSPVDKEGEE